MQCALGLYYHQWWCHPCQQHWWFSRRLLFFGTRNGFVQHDVAALQTSLQATPLKLYSIGGLVMAQLVERSLLTREMRGSNPNCKQDSTSNSK